MNRTEIGVKIEWDVRVKMRDGVELSTDLYLPDVGHKVPAIILRTPYGKNESKSIDNANYFASNGYAVLYQDVRGRGDSDGKFRPYFNDSKDGYDTIEWASKQDWCSGDVGTMGGSYLAMIQWLTALEHPPHLKAMISIVSPSDPFVENPTGVQDPMHLSWHFMVSGKVMQNVDVVNWESIYRQLPLSTMDEKTGRRIKAWQDAYEHTKLDEYWEPLRYQNRFSEIDLPVLHISGWYDDEQIGTPLNFIGMTKHGKSPKARKSQKLIMGPWPHGVNKATKLGDIDFGPDSVVDLQGLEKEWFDHWLKNIDNSIVGTKPVNIFVMGTNVWRTENEWPIKRSKSINYYFNSKGRANSRFGDGVLTLDDPIEHSPPDLFDYDPEYPVPFITEQTSAQIGGPDDYSSVERRDDVLVYSGERLKKSLEVTGPIMARLYVQSSGPDTDFTVKLLDVWPNGFAQRLCDGMVRARFRNGMDREEFLEPGKIYQMDVNLWNTSNVFLPGHAIRVEVSSSAFPKYSRNLNTVEKLGKGSSFVIAHQTVYHDKERPSHIILPIVE